MAKHSTLLNILILHNVQLILIMASSYFVLFSFVCFNSLFYIDVEPINSAMIVSGGQQRDSVIRIHVSILPWTEEPGRLQSMGLQRVRHG